MVALSLVDSTQCTCGHTVGGNHVLYMWPCATHTYHLSQEFSQSIQYRYRTLHILGWSLPITLVGMPHTSLSALHVFNAPHSLSVPLGPTSFTPWNVIHLCLSRWVFDSTFSPRKLSKLSSWEVNVRLFIGIPTTKCNSCVTIVEVGVVTCHTVRIWNAMSAIV